MSKQMNLIKREECSTRIVHSQDHRHCDLHAADLYVDLFEHDRFRGFWSQLLPVGMFESPFQSFILEN